VSQQANIAPPGPVRVVILDLEDPIPELAPDGRYESAMVVGRRGGVPTGVVDVDLRTGRFDLQEQLRPLFAGSAARQSSVPAESADLPSISVVVPTIVARTEDLEHLLAGFEQVRYPDVEYILVDNRRAIPTPDPLPGLLVGRTGIRVVREERPGISAARNAGVAAATGDIVVFTDDDVRVDPQWLLAIGRRFASDPAIDAVTGLILPAELETPAQVWFERYYGGFSGERTFAPLTLQAERVGPRSLRGSRIAVTDADGGLVRTFAVYGAGAFGAGANMAFRRSTLQRLGGFDLALGTGTPARGGEDLAALISVLWNAGKVGYEPASVVHHRHRREVAELEHQLRGNGVGFTAMLTSLVSHDRRHVLGLASQLPLAAAAMARQSLARVQGRRKTRSAEPETEQSGAAQFPRSLVLNELRGYPKGPFAYLRSRQSTAGWSARSGDGANPPVAAGAQFAPVPSTPGPSTPAPSHLPPAPSRLT
jgi:hypothetical protein